MDALPKYLQYGEQITFDARSTIYSAGDPVGEKPVLYVVAGLVKVEYATLESTFTLWTPPDGLLGLVEPLAECKRLCVAHAMERTIVYRWDLEGFYTASGVSWELALLAITGLTRELRILNAEVDERLGRLQGSSQ
jgi:hypothetical protein